MSTSSKMTQDGRPTAVSTSGPIKMGTATIIGLHPTNIHSSTATAAPVTYSAPIIHRTAPPQAQQAEVKQVSSIVAGWEASKKPPPSAVALPPDASLKPKELDSAEVNSKISSSSPLSLIEHGTSQTVSQDTAAPSQILTTSKQEEEIVTAAEEEADTVSLTKAPPSTTNLDELNMEPIAVDDTKTKATTIVIDSSPNIPINPTMSLIDRDVVQLVPLIISSLQIHGPMDEDQLLHNLPPFTHSFLLKFMKHPPSNGIVEMNQRYSLSVLILQDILQVLMALNVIYLESERMVNNHPPPQDDCGGLVAVPESTEAPILPPPKKKKRRYFFLDGIPRNEYNVIQPKEVYSLIQQANEEIDHSLERISLLQAFLLGQDPFKNPVVSTKGPTEIDEAQTVNDQEMDNQEKIPMPFTDCKVEEKIEPSQQTKTAREFLKNLLQKYPEIVTDSVYFSALKNFSIDVSDKDKGNSQISTEGGGGGGGIQDAGGNKNIKRRGRKRKSPEEESPKVTQSNKDENNKVEVSKS